MRILHFVTGGFSGATQVAIDLSLAALCTPGYEVLLVLRRKPSTDEAKVEKLHHQGLQVRIVSNWIHAITVWELRKIMREFKPDAVFAHGFSDHIWGRRAAVAEGVPRIFHVEHNTKERYTRRRLAQAQALMPYTEACIGVSEGVRTSLIDRGFDPAKCIAIPNGIDLERFSESILKPWNEREPAIIMASRFARQKDHETLIHAMALLKSQGITSTLYLAGGGKSSLQRKAKVLVTRLNLEEQVQFLGNVNDLPQRLGATQIFVLSTHWEGMPLALVEGMAAACACVVTNVIGAREVITPNDTGLKVNENDVEDMARALRQLLGNSAEANRLGQAARQQAVSSYGRHQMWHSYQALLQKSSHQISHNNPTSSQ